jgi:hypothetical protein
MSQTLKNRRISEHKSLPHDVIDADIRNYWTLNTLAIRTKLSTMSEQIPSTELSGYYAWTRTLQGVYYGPGSVSTALPTLLDTLGASKALVVTGNTLYTKVCLIKPPFPSP